MPEAGLPACREPSRQPLLEVRQGVRWQALAATQGCSGHSGPVQCRQALPMLGSLQTAPIWHPQGRPKLRVLQASDKYSAQPPPGNQELARRNGWCFKCHNMHARMYGQLLNLRQILEDHRSGTSAGMVWHFTHSCLPVPDSQAAPARLSWEMPRTAQKPVAASARCNGCMLYSVQPWAAPVGRPGGLLGGAEAAALLGHAGAHGLRAAAWRVVHPASVPATLGPQLP